MLKAIATPHGTTSVEFVQMLIQLGEFKKDGLIDMVGFLEFNPTAEVCPVSNSRLCLLRLISPR
jgi:hypothetical protein